MKTVILAGGYGTRLREETEFKPKPLVEIGNMPILWHIMMGYAHFGYKDFVIPLGYKGNLIKRFFFDYQFNSSDLILDQDLEFGLRKVTLPNNWKVHLRDTGLDTNTGGRLFKLRDILKRNTFFCTYGDGLANVNIEKLLEFHRKMGRVATVTCGIPISRFGSVDFDDTGLVKSFVEKPKSDSFVSAGFFVFEPEIFDYLNEFSVLENEPLETLAKEEQLSAFKHVEFWRPMDTYRETLELNRMWNNNEAPWKIW